MSVETILATLVGAVLGWLANWYFSRKGGSELRAEAGRLRAETVLVRQTVNALGDAMEQEGWVTLERDQDGNIIRVQRARPAGTASSEMSGTPIATITPLAAPSSTQPQ